MPNEDDEPETGFEIVPKPARDGEPEPLPPVPETELEAVVPAHEPELEPLPSVIIAPEPAPEPTRRDPTCVTRHNANCGCTGEHRGPIA